MEAAEPKTTKAALTGKRAIRPPKAGRATGGTLRSSATNPDLHDVRSQGGESQSRQPPGLSREALSQLELQRPGSRASSTAKLPHSTGRRQTGAPQQLPASSRKSAQQQPSIHDGPKSLLAVELAEISQKYKDGDCRYCRRSMR